MQESGVVKRGLMTRLGRTNVVLFSSVLGAVVLTELIRYLDIVPITFLFPWKVIFFGTAVLVLTLAFLFSWLRLRGWKFQFSTRELLALGFIVAWPLSRFTVEANVERTRIQSQQDCFEMAKNLRPTAKQVSMSGRYNDGRNDFEIQRWLVMAIASCINVNEIRFEIGDIASLDLTGTDIVDNQLDIVAKTRSVSELNLSSTKITDAGLEHLHGLRSLKLLKLTNTSVSTHAIERLKRALPGLIVEQ